MDFTRVFRDVEIKEIYGNRNADIEIKKITSNCDEADEYSVFVAIYGKKCDGHIKICDAVSNGCRIVVCENITDINEKITYIVVNDSRRTIALISANLYDRPAEKLKIIGITGTNGKTTTAYMLNHILNVNGVKCGIIGTLGAYFDRIEYTGYTTPEAPLLHKILSEAVKNGYTHVIIEVSSQALVQERVYGIRFELGVFLNLSVDHLDYHGNMKAYGEAKLKLFYVSNHTLANADSDFAFPFVSYGGTKTFSLCQSADFTANNIALSASGGEFNFSYGKEKFYAKTGCVGIYNVENSLAALSSAVILGADSMKSVDALNLFVGVPGRTERVENDIGINIFIDFAHTPDGLEKLLSALKIRARGKIILVFGCGGDRDKSKRPEMGKIAEKKADKIIVTSDNPRTENPNDIISDIINGIENTDKVTAIPDRKIAIKEALLSAEKGDTVILAGKGHEKYQEINGVKYPFDERETVISFINEIKFEREKGK